MSKDQYITNSIKMKYDVLYNFISPVTGHSSTLAPSSATYILQTPDPNLPNAQALNSLNNGIIFNNDDGVLSTKSKIDRSNLPYLTKNKIWIGDPQNIAIEDNLNSLIKSILNSLIASGVSSGIGAILDNVLGFPGLNLARALVYALALKAFSDGDSINNQNINYLQLYVGMNMGGNRITNLSFSPIADSDAVTAKWVYDLLNDNVLINEMGMSRFVAGNIHPELYVLGAVQEFKYNQNLSTLRLSNSFTPTSLISSQTNLEFRNNLLSGFRWIHTTNNTDTYGSLILQSFINSSSTGTNLINFTNNGIATFVPVQFYNPLGTNYVALQAGNVTSNVTWTLPTTDGSAGQALITNGSGILSWSSTGVGSVTSITAGTGLTGGTITTSGTIGLDIPVSLAHGGTGANLVASGGGIFYSTASTTAISGIGTSGQVLTSQGTGAPIWTTPTTGTVSSISQGSNIVCTPNPITLTGTVALSNTPSGLTSIGVGNLSLTGNTISSTSSNENINISPNGNGVFIVNAGSIGSAQWSNQPIFHGNSNSGNTDNLRIINVRYIAGSDWTSSEMRLQKIVDSTYQHYISFRGNSGFLSTLVFGYGGFTSGTELAALSQDGKWTIGSTTTTAPLMVCDTPTENTKFGSVQIVRAHNPGDNLFYLSFVNQGWASAGIGFVRNSINTIFGIWNTQDCSGTPSISFDRNQRVGIGITNPSSDSMVHIVPVSNISNGLLLNGSYGSNTNLTGIWNTPTLVPINNKVNIYPFDNQPTITCPSIGIGAIYGNYNSYNINGTGIIDYLYGIYVGDGNVTGPTVSLGCGLYVAPLDYGNTRYGIFINAPTGGTIKCALYTDNASIGYTGINPPTNGLIISGNVGIGNTNPNTYLTVGPNGGVNGTGNIPGISMKSDIVSTMSFSVGQSDTTNAFFKWVYNATPNDGYASISTYQGNNNLILNESGGNVGIGTTNPFSRFHVFNGFTPAPNYLLPFSPLFRIEGSNLSQTIGADINLASFMYSTSKTGGNYCGLGIHAYRFSNTTNDWQTTAIVLGIDVDNVIRASPYIAICGNKGIGLNTVTASNLLDINGAVSIGYSNVVAPTNGLIISGNVGIGTNTVYTGSKLHIGGTLIATDPQGYQQTVYLNQTLNPNGGGHSAGLVLQSSFVANTAQTISTAASIEVFSVYANNVGTITNAYGLLVDSGSTNSGTVTNCFGGYFKQPAAGINKYALYSDNLAISTFNNYDKLIVAGGAIVSESQSPSIAWMGDIPTARWLSKLGGFNLTFNCDSSNTFSTGDNVTYQGYTFRSKIVFGPDGSISAYGISQNTQILSRVSISGFTSTKLFPSGVFTTVNFSDFLTTSSYDPNSWWNGNSFVTVPAGGRYFLSAAVRFVDQSGGDGGGFNFFVNGSPTAAEFIFARVGNRRSAAGQGMFWLNGGDTITLRVWQDSGSNVSISYINFTVERYS